MEFESRDVALVGVLAALANVLSFFAIPGPWNIKFSMTAIPILLAAFARGPLIGALTGLFGGIVQAIQYGWIGYVIYTAIQGGVAGFLAKRPKLARALAPIILFFGGFFLLWWVDLMLGGQVSFEDILQATEKAAQTTAAESLKYLPIYGVIGGIALALLGLLLAKRGTEFDVLLLAGIAGAVAYVPYDAFALYVVQQYPWIPTWFVLAKDLVQDFVAAALTAILALNPRMRRWIE